MGVEFFDGVPIFTSNSVTNQNKEYYVSYEPSARNYGVDTTAFVSYDKVGNSIFYILEGNHVKNYEKCQTFQEHMDYFKNNINLMHKYSDKHYIHLVLDFIGIDSHGRPTYREYSKFFHRPYFKCTDLKKESREGLCTAEAFDSEPDTPIEFTKYKNVIKIEWRDENDNIQD